VNEEQGHGIAVPHGRPARPMIVDSEGKVRIGEEVAAPLALSIIAGRVEQCCVDTGFSLMLEVSALWWVLDTVDLWCGVAFGAGLVVVVAQELVKVS
jgi:hypothetical protein